MHPSTTKALFDLKCPKCRVGHLFSDERLYNYRDISAANSKCPKCNQDFEIEPGFYYAAMFISYAVNVVYFMVLTAITFLVWRPDNIWYYALIGFIWSMSVLPYTYRFSRAVGLYFLTSIRFSQELYTKYKA